MSARTTRVTAGPGDVGGRVARRAGVEVAGGGPVAVLPVDPAERRLPDAALLVALETVLADGPRVDALDLVLVFAQDFASTWTRRLVTQVEDPGLRLRPRVSTDMETSESVRWTLDALGQGTPGEVLVVVSGWDADLARTLTDGLGSSLVVRYRTWGDDPRDTDVEVVLRTAPPAVASTPAVVVSGVGLVTAYGSGVGTFVDGLALGRDPLPDLPRTSVTRPIAVPGAPGDWLSDALAQALAEARWTGAEPPRLVLGAQATRPAGVAAGNPIWATGPVRTDAWTWDESLVVSHACASALFALALAVRLVRSGREPAVLVAGVSACTPCMVDSLGVVRALGTSPSRPFDEGRDGITIGEGSGAVLVETLASARARGVEPAAEVAATVAVVRGRSAAASDSDAVAGCLRRAVADAGVTAVDYVHAHATGTPQGDQAELDALGLLAAELDGGPFAVSSHKGALGHLLHASALPGIVVGVEAVRRGVVPGTVNLRTPVAQDAVRLVGNGELVAPRAGVRTVLVNAFGFGGNNASVVLRTPELASGAEPSDHHREKHR